MRPVSKEDRIRKEERDSYHRGERYPVYVILNQLKGVSPEDVALSYSASVLSLPKTRLLSYNGDEDSVDFFKKKFQGETRIGLYLLAQRINLGGKSFSSLKPDYESTIERALEAVREGNLPLTERTAGKQRLKFQEGTIERVISERVNVNSPDWLGIYNALQAGAESFRTYLTKNGRDHRSLEYNHILRSLREIR